MKERKITQETFRIEYTRYFKNQVCSASANSIEQANETVAYYKQWEKDAKIVGHWVKYEGSDEWVKVA